MVRRLMGLSGLHRQLARVAAIWLLSASLVRSQNFAGYVSRHTNSTSQTVATEASVSEDEKQKVGIPSSRKRGSPHLELDLGDQQTPEEARGAPSNATIPPPRCANREEWQGVCRWWSGKSHNRYLVLKNFRSPEGIGANLMRITWALNRAISFDLEPFFVGPIRAGHGTGDFGDWMGLTHNPLLAIQDPEAFSKATEQNVPFPEGDGDDWFRGQENRTSVAYQAEAMSVKKIKDYGIPVSKPNPDPRACPYVRQALRYIYWSVPENRGRCRGLLPDDHHVPPRAVVSGSAGYQLEGKRPWVLAVHVRRGDMIHFKGGRNTVKHAYYSAAVSSVLRGIAATDPAARVSALVFSEGPAELKELQLENEHGKPVTWDIEHESCLDIGLNCSQKVYLKTSACETLDCLAAADVVVGSKSSFSQAAAALSTNVKVVLRGTHTEPGWVTLNSTAVASAGAVSSDEQLEINAAIADWWYCSGEVQQSTGSDPESLAARSFYQTVDERFPSR